LFENANVSRDLSINIGKCHPEKYGFPFISDEDQSALEMP
jgi:hypothetical protein